MKQIILNIWYEITMRRIDRLINMKNRKPDRYWKLCNLVHKINNYERSRY